MSSCTQEDGDQLVVTVNGQGISKDILIHRYKVSEDYTKANALTPIALKSFINDVLIEDLYFLAEGYNQKFDQDSSFMLAMESEKRRLLTRRDGPLYEKIIPQQINLDESEIQWVYQHSNVRLQLAHIQVISHQLADSLYNLIKNGDNFSDLAKRFSMDYNTARNGGVFERMIGVGMMGKDFEQVAFNLKKNQISQPIETFRGYHLIKLLNRQETRLEPYEKVKTNMEFIARNLKLSEIINQYILGLYDKYHFSLNQSLIPKILEAYRFENNNHFILKDQFKQAELEQEIASYDGGGLNLKAFINAFNETHVSKKHALRYKEDVEDFLKASLGMDLMYQDAKKYKLDQDKDFVKSFTYTKNQKLIRLTKNKIVFSKVEINKQDLTNAYELTKDKWQGKSLEKIMPILTNRLKSQKSKEIYSTVLEKLKEKYRVVYNESLIEQAVDEINEQKESTS